MTDILVETEPSGSGWRCQVRVDEANGSWTDHVVTVSTADLARLDPGATDPTDLVRRSFAFLLEREPKDAIFRTFDLPVIGRYFPEYEATIRDR